MKRAAVMMALVLGATVPGARAFAQVDGTEELPGPVHRAKGDIEGDGRSNILMLHVKLDPEDHRECPDDPDPERGPMPPHVHRSTHTDWGMAGLVAKPQDPLPEGPWQVTATGDFNGDGNPDLFWQMLVDDLRDGFASPGRIEHLGVTLTLADDPHHYVVPPTEAIAPPVGPWTHIGAGDFGGIGRGGRLAPPDGRDDLLWRNDDTGDLTVWISDGAGAFPAEYALENREPTAIPQVVADLDGDGRAEIVARDSVTDRLTYWKMNGTSHESEPLDPDHVADFNWQLVGAGDFDGDGMDDLLWRNVDQLKLVVWFMQNGHRSAGGFVTQTGSPDPTRLGADPEQFKCNRWVIAGPR